jgi:hypothetical protein
MYKTSCAVRLIYTLARCVHGSKLKKGRLLTFHEAAQEAVDGNSQGTIL